MPELNKNTGTNYQGSTLDLTDWGYVQNEFEVGENLIVNGDIILKGDIKKRNADGTETKVDAVETMNSDVGLAAIEDSKNSTINGFIPTSADTADISIDDDNSRTIKNTVTFRENSASDTSYKSTLYAHQAFVPGAVVSTTGFCADNVHGCVDNYDSSTGVRGNTSDTDSNKTYVLPNLVYSENIHCKRIYPKDFNCCTDGDNNAIRDEDEWKNSVISVESKRLKLDTLDAKNIETTESMKTNNFEAYGDVKFNSTVNFSGQLLVGNGAESGRQESLVANTIRARSISVNNDVTTTSTITKTLQVSEIQSNNNNDNPDIKNMITVNTTIDGDTRVLTGAIDVTYLTDDNDHVPFRTFTITPKNDYTLSFLTFTSQDSNIDQQISMPSVKELLVFHGTYCTNTDVFQCANLLLNKIDKSERQLYYDSSKSDEMLKELCCLSEDINMSADLKYNARLKDKFFTFFANLKNITEHTAYFRRYYYVDITDTSYYYVYVGLKPYVKIQDSSSYTEPCLVIAINKTTLECSFFYAKSIADTAKINYTIDGNDALEYVLQFLLFSYIAELVRCVHQKEIGDTYSDFFIGRSMNNPDFIEEWKQNMTMSRDKFADYIRWFTGSDGWERNYWAAFKRYLLDSSSDLTEDICTDNTYKKLFDCDSLCLYAVIAIANKMKSTQIYWLREGYNPTWEWYIEGVDGAYTITCEDKDVNVPVLSTAAISNIEGDVTMEGDLTVNNISSSDGSPVRITNLDVTTLTIDGNPINISSENLSNKLKCNKETVRFYTASKINGGDCGDYHATVDLDLNYIGDMLFVGVRPITIVGTSKIENYYPTSSSRGRGCFKIGISEYKINPYNFRICDDVADTGRMRIGYTFDGSDPTDPKYTYGVNGIQPENLYIVAETMVNFYYVNSPTSYDQTASNANVSDAESKISRKVYFVMNERYNEYLNLYYPDDIDSYQELDSFANYSLAYMVIDGFRFTAVKSWGAETSAADTFYYPAYKNITGNTATPKPSQGTGTGTGTGGTTEQVS